LLLEVIGRVERRAIDCLRFRSVCRPRSIPQSSFVNTGRVAVLICRVGQRITRISREYNHPIIEITESGCGYLDGPDEEENGRIPDGRRIQWYREVLAELARAIADGARVRAFHAWTLLDNFQWAEGYTERYGLIYTDFRNQKRTIKDSGFWFGRVAASNRLNV
jgi:beta-glucosidase/6-phospho-beta-glucosidase/beta-galactosidase